MRSRGAEERRQRRALRRGQRFFIQGARARPMTSAEAGFTRSTNCPRRGAASCSMWHARAYYRGEPVSEADLAVMRLIDEPSPVAVLRSRRMRRVGGARAHGQPAGPAPDASDGLEPCIHGVERASRARGTRFTPTCSGTSIDGQVTSPTSPWPRGSCTWWRSWTGTRRVLSWRVSNTLDADFCIEALEDALQRFEAPEIFNTDQGCQFTCEAFTDVLKDHAIAISMDVGQRVRRASVAQCQVRGRVPAGLRAHRASGRTGPLLRFLQHQAPSQRTGPTYPRCGVLRPGSPRFGSLKPDEDFTYRTVQFPGSISDLSFIELTRHCTGVASVRMRGS